jgi:beta-glucosidase-like glycosyl hydrolase
VNTQDAIGAHIMPRLDVPRYNEDSEYKVFIHSLISGYGMLGFCVFGRTKTIVRETLHSLQEVRAKSGGRKLLFSIDAEWGAAMRISDGTEFPHAFALAKTGDVSLVEKAAHSIGHELRSLGLHWNFAPVADINSNRDNPIINIRSFGENAHDVALYASAFNVGLRSAGVLTSAKHFPGHGDTHVDSHQGLPSIDRSLEEFMKSELMPFQVLISQNIPSIMLGHLSAPKLARELGASEIGANLPATISYPIVTTLLREKMGYDGVVITDSLEMAGIRKLGFSDPDIAFRCIDAGVDILLMPPDPIAAYEVLRGKELDSSRIDTLFESEGKPHMLYDDTDLPLLVAQKAIHVSGALTSGSSAFSVLHKDNEQDKAKANFISNSLIGKGYHLIDSAEDGTIIIIIDRPRGQLADEKQTAGIGQKIESLIARFKEKKTFPRGIILLGNPYLEEALSELHPAFVLNAYSDSMPSVLAVLELL